MMPKNRQAAILEKLTSLYGNAACVTLERIGELSQRYRDTLQTTSRESLWDERDVVLITYGDQVQCPNQSPLRTLAVFLHETGLRELFSVIHILPFFPYSSDDGFSVIDYRQVDSHLGTWDDIAALGQSVDLMFDLVLNHCSKRNAWFEKYLRQETPYADFFIESSPETDLSAVTRPRSAPLLTPFETAAGTKYVWTTFSDDQVDLNFANPDVLLEMLDILLSYVASGARIIRLDAIAYLWKTPGTSCIHLPETHTVVRLMRDLLDELAPGTILLTETNVPHRENVSYFGNGDEAHMVYQFSLAPLLLDAFLSGDAAVLNAWLTNLEQLEAGMTYFNFTASHDGVGVRPLEGLVSPERLDKLVEEIRKRGGQVSTKRNPDGSDSPYELNVTYFSALGWPDDNNNNTEQHVRRFLSSQGLMLALRGIPGVYFHSLVGTPNDTAGMQQTGRARTINRRKFQLDELRQQLDKSGSAQKSIFDEYRRMLDVRIRQPAFHPDASQTVVDFGKPGLIAFQRTSLDGQQTIVVLCNVSQNPVEIDLERFATLRLDRDLLGGQSVTGDTFRLDPFQLVWLAESRSS